jgi:Tol biopolymer transport system component
VLLYHLDSRTYERLTDFGGRPRWLGDSRRLVFDSDDGKLFLVDSRTRTSYELLSARGEGLFQPVVTRDGRWIYFMSRNTESDIWLATFPVDQASSDRR